MSELVTKYPNKSLHEIIDELEKQLLRLAKFANVHRSVKDSTTPEEIAIWIEQSVKSELRQRSRGTPITPEEGEWIAEDLRKRIEGEIDADAVTTFTPAIPSGLSRPDVDIEKAFERFTGKTSEETQREFLFGMTFQEMKDLKQTVTQLQQMNSRLVDERRAADIHYRDVKVVYVAHPLSGPDRDANIQRAARWCAWAFKSGYAPVADWIVLASQLDESYREQGLRVDCALIKRCDELWQVGGWISDGMRIEAATAKLVGVPVKDMTALGEEPPEWLHPGTEFVDLRKEVSP